jgi:hypothetical protein
MENSGNRLSGFAFDLRTTCLNGLWACFLQVLWSQQNFSFIGNPLQFIICNNRTLMNS